MVSLQSESKKIADTYINANYVANPFRGTPKQFIAAQAPIPKTIASFWKMVWQESVLFVVTLCGMEEHGRVACHVYWPDPDLSKQKLVFGDFEISHLSTEKTNDFFWVRTFQLKVRAPHAEPADERVASDHPVPRSCGSPRASAGLTGKSPPRSTTSSSTS